MQLTVKNTNVVAATQTAANLQTAAAHAANAHTQNTNRSYKNDLKLVSAYFPNFVNETFQVVTPLTATDVAAFIGHLITTGHTKHGIQQVYKPSTLQHLLNVISSTHKVSNLDSPINKAVRAIVTGYGKTLNEGEPYEQKQAKAIEDTHIVKAINRDTFDTTTNRGLRDKAIVLLSFAGCARRNEVAQLKVSNLIFDGEGVHVTVLNTKTGTKKKYIKLTTNVETCTVTAVKNWIAAAKLTKDSYLFPSIIKGDKIDTTTHIAGETINRIVKSTFGSEYSGHGFRVGFVVTAKKKKASNEAIRIAGGWEGDAMVRHYGKSVTAKQNSFDIFG
jgi:site-specific recombinase XerD